MSCLASHGLNPPPPPPRSVAVLQVLVALQRLVHSLGPESPSTYPMLLPVLKLCTDPHQPDELNLLEDGLQLWLVALRHAPAPCTGLLGDLFPNLVAAMTRSTEHIAVREGLEGAVLGGGRGLTTGGWGDGWVVRGGCALCPCGLPDREAGAQAVRELRCV